MSRPEGPAYRADIDGLRAIAVGAVIAFHAFPVMAHGGFVGVDVFFVISGYLISGLILRDLEQGRFSFANFYGRRIRRIFPALIVLLTFCLGLGWFILIDDEYKMLGNQIGAAAAFISNFAFWNESGYFDTAAEFKPLLHLWSLGIEEQFYILWPALLVVVCRFGLNALLITAVLGVISFWLNLSHVIQDRAWAFFLPQARLWELAVGGVCAYLTLHARTPLGPRYQPIARCIVSHKALIGTAASIVGIGLIGFSFVVLTKFDSFPGWWATLPVSGAALIIVAGPGALVNRLLLSRRVLVFVGLISFPLYLWHWPLLVFARIFRGWQPGLARIAVVAIAFVLAWLTYEFVEKKIRFRRRALVPVLLIGFLALVGVAGYIVSRLDGVPARFNEFAGVSQVRQEWAFNPGPDLHRVTFAGSYFMQQKAIGLGAVLFVGDSNAEQYWSRIDELIKTDPRRVQSVTFKTGAGCLPIVGVHSDAEAHCDSLAVDALAYAMHANVRTVVFAADWWAYFEGAYGYTLTDRGTRYALNDPVGFAGAVDRFRSMLRDLRAADKTVFVVLNIPIGEGVDPRNMLHRSFSGIRLEAGPPVRLSALLSRYGSVEARLSAAADDAGATVIRPTDYLCSNDACPIVDARGQPMYIDASHLRPSYVRKHATFIDAVMDSPVDGPNVHLDRQSVK
jgi:peptidoglycan/LPS O-acetylase OafA/YrhL